MPADPMAAQKGAYCGHHSSAEANMRQVIALLCLALCSCSDRGEDGDPGGPAPDLGTARDLSPPGDLCRAPCQPRHAARPVAPSDKEFMWQGQQRRFLDAEGQPCAVRVSLAISDQAFCFTAADDTLRCAGRIYQTTFGPRFVAAGPLGVDQISIMPTFNSETGNAICVHKADGTAACMGDANGHGEFATGDRLPQRGFVSWGGAAGLAAIGIGAGGSGTCSLDGMGQIRCAGGPYPLAPTDVGPPGRRSFWITTFGELRPDDADVRRASNIRTNCQVRAEGLTCYGRLHGPAGHIVDGNEVDGARMGPGMAACWLTDDGQVGCSDGGRRFSDGKVLFLALSPYTDSLCAAYADGSLRCVGSNRQGKLGTGDDLDLARETEVAPPGTISTLCEEGTPK
jgi:hypothetical protein